MSNAFSDYEVNGTADPRRARNAALIDLGVGAFLGVLAWPFPVMRIVLTDVAGSVALGWVAHVALLLGFMALMDLAYIAFATAFLRRTVGMYLQDLGFADDVPGLGAAFAVGLPWVVAGISGVVGASGPAGSVGAARLGDTKSGR